jgi:hypothetical protein
MTKEQVKEILEISACRRDAILRHASAATPRVPFGIRGV